MQLGSNALIRDGGSGVEGVNRYNVYGSFLCNSRAICRSQTSVTKLVVKASRLQTSICLVTGEKCSDFKHVSIRG